MKGLDFEEFLMKVKHKEISHNKVIELTEIFIEYSQDLELRLSSINSLKFLEIKDQKVYNILENLLVSDNNPKIRTQAALLLLERFTNICKNLIYWVFENEKNIDVLLEINKFLSNSENTEHKNILFKLHESLSNVYNIVQKEVQFLLEIEKLIGRSREIGYYRPHTEKNHIISLELGGYNIKNLPSSIGHLKNLRYLNLWNNNLTRLPKTIESLTNLEQLYLDWNNFFEVPNIGWHKLISLKKLSITNNFNLNSLPDSLYRFAKINLAPKYIVEGVNSSQAAVLGLIEILTGQKLEKIMDLNHLNKFYACNYQINENGDVIGVYLYGYHSFQINFCPRILLSFIALEELVLRDQNLQIFPIWISEFKQLRKIDLLNNKITQIPKSIERCRKLKYLDLEGNKVNNLSQLDLKMVKEIWI